ncbi:MAG: GDP-mannose 4,6-dehydratase, partial [Patescibacteria group bacterium]|nr:GDP-mannose 4,6-dehydratase [Patescibacteria group bacterium]
FLKRIEKQDAPIIYGDGSQTRDFVYVGDVAKANLLAMKSNVKNSFINVGTGVGISIKDLAYMIIDSSGLKMKPIFKKALKGDVKESRADITLSHKLLGWKAKVKLREWLEKR